MFNVRGMSKTKTYFSPKKTGLTLILVGMGFYLVAERIVAIVPYLPQTNLGHGDPKPRTTPNRRTPTQRQWLKAMDQEGIVLDMTRGRKIASLVLLDTGQVVKSMYTPKALVSRIVGRTTKNLVRKDEAGVVVDLAGSEVAEGEPE